jgi:hypothetical protein
MESGPFGRTYHQDGTEGNEFRPFLEFIPSPDIIGAEGVRVTFEIDAQFKGKGLLMEGEPGAPPGPQLEKPLPRWFLALLSQP